METSPETTESFFKLLIPASASTTSNNKITILCGQPWELVEFNRLEDAPPYTAISYSWTLEKNQTESKRTIPVIETVIKAFQSIESQEKAVKSYFQDSERTTEQLKLMHAASRAIWIDSLCVSKDQALANVCIHNMGIIYKKATQVFVALNAECEGTVLKISNNEQLNLSDYEAVASDDWIDRIWTYQEIANSKLMFIVAEGEGSVLISELQFLNSLMYDDAAYTNTSDTDLYQKLERMQRLIAEQNIGKRSAFQVMSSIQNRHSSGDESLNRINVMLAVISDEFIMDKSQNVTALVEKFVSICEKNNDYSFIFSRNERSAELGKQWRPIGDKIEPVVSNVVMLGSGLSANFKGTHLQMKNMCRMLPNKINSVTKKVEGFLNIDLSKEILEQLKQRGFNGTGKCVKLEHGYFFSQKSHKPSSNFFIVISHDVKFQQGAPALLLRSTDTNLYKFCDVGVFIGAAPSASEIINVC